ncbi:hypothetical protein B0181_04895 [Moraxella caviae]|uniref:Lipoprotein n=1 Tax=Moraxella caviae TaxID=34060 RepID=A0A1T0A3J0_9GAMM|nr:hypothetical protein [Moraxella caviae]OOR90250.1 hypothetical protein B0181_04895 [Moraxella caviae]STZ14567.1 Uncharacterised protein [Moraxella caviae]VEW12572.1 Uncharacterised protein [Moraxella caviae]
MPHKFFTRLSAISLIITACTLAACSEPQPVNEPKLASSQPLVKQSDGALSSVIADFIGCYTVSHDEPAQIKLSEKDGKLVMQMKEAANKGRVWDSPEPLEALSMAKGWQYFNVNALDLDSQDVSAVVARPDGMMALAKVRAEAANVNPLLDSEYVAYIVRGTNTIYKVACDDTPTDLLGAQGH